MARKVMHVVHKNAKGWILEEEGGSELGTFETKDEAIKAGQKRGRGSQQRAQDAQVIIHHQDGSIETEYTYGHDPRRTAG
jgi:hypothetical protein